MNSKFCKHCNTEHPNTAQFWNKVGAGKQCKQYFKDYRKANAEKNRAKVREKSRKWREENPGYAKQAAAKFYSKHKEKVIARNYEYAKRKRKEDKTYNMAILLRQRLNKAIKGKYKAGSAVEDLGCSVEFFVKYLEGKFSSGMTWENYGRSGWHIDHIVPLASFNLENPDEFKRAVHYTNLQPLWAHENCSKSNKILTV